MSLAHAVSRRRRCGFSSVTNRLAQGEAGFPGQRRSSCATANIWTSRWTLRIWRRLSPRDSASGRARAGSMRSPFRRPEERPNDYTASPLCGRCGRCEGAVVLRYRMANPYPSKRPAPRDSHLRRTTVPLSSKLPEWGAPRYTTWVSAVKG